MVAKGIIPFDWDSIGLDDLDWDSIGLDDLDLDSLTHILTEPI